MSYLLKQMQYVKHRSRLSRWKKDDAAIESGDHEDCLRVRRYIDTG
jgi:hypothetical protein